MNAVDEIRALGELRLAELALSASSIVANTNETQITWLLAMSWLEKLDRNGGDIVALEKSFCRLKDLAATQATHFGPPDQPSFTADSIVLYLEKHRRPILLGMLLFENGAMFEAVKKGQVKFNDFLERIELLLKHPECAILLHDICRQRDAKGDRVSDFAFVLIGISAGSLKSNQQTQLLKALAMLKESPSGSTARERTTWFGFEYAQIQLADWGVTTSPENIERACDLKQRFSQSSSNLKLKMRPVMRR